MSRVLYCPQCEALVEGGQERCVMCGNDLTVDQPLLEPPSFYRQQAEHAAAEEAAEPSMALGVMAWFAQIFAGIWLLIFCILPVLLVIVGVIVVLFSAGR